jgi:ribosomal protein L17
MIALYGHLGKSSSERKEGGYSHSLKVAEREQDSAGHGKVKMFTAKAYLDI